MIFEKKLQVGTTDSFSFGVSKFLKGEELVSCTAVSCTNALLVTNATCQGSTVFFLAEAKEPFLCPIIITFATPTRNDRVKVSIQTIPAMSC
jgi:hypothetical protein